MLQLAGQVGHLHYVSDNATMGDAVRGNALWASSKSDEGDHSHGSAAVAREYLQVSAGARHNRPDSAWRALGSLAQTGYGKRYSGLFRQLGSTIPFTLQAFVPYRASNRGEVAL